MPLLNASQIDQASLNLAIQRGASGAAFSGNFLAYVQGFGYLGPLAVTVTGIQDITGLKTFRDSPRVPYSGTTESAPSAQWVIDRAAAYSGWANGTFLISSNLTNMSGQLSTNLYQTGSNLYVTMTGMSGALAGGGGGGAVYDVVYTSGAQSITGVKTFISSPQVPQTIAPTPPGGSWSNTVGFDDLVIVSGDIVAQIMGGGGSPNSVTTTGNEVIGGFKQFTGSPFVPAPTQPSGAANLSWTSGVSGALYARMTGISGAITPGQIIYTGTTNNIAVSGVTGNFVNVSYYFDEYSLSTGLNVTEAFIGRSFFFTGYAIGTITSGTQGSFSGSFYQRNQTNVKTAFVNFGMPAGQFFSGRGGFVQEVSGLNRVGLDIYLIGTGITGLSVGLFGVGY